MDTVVFLSTSGLQTIQGNVSKSQIHISSLENMPLLKERW